jgi:hypothetical protein
METNPAWSVWQPMEFQFTEPEDVKAYGDRWYSYSEPALIRRPARELLELEAHLGIPLVDVMNSMRVSATIGTLAAAWIGVRDFDPKLAGDFDDFNPLTLTITWRPAVDEGKAESVAEVITPPPPDAGFPPESSDRETSAPTDIVTLSTSPIVE